MESRRSAYLEAARILVRLRDDSIVSSSVKTASLPGGADVLDSILIPWVTVREVKVEVEIVRCVMRIHYTSE